MEQAILLCVPYAYAKAATCPARAFGDNYIYKMMVENPAVAFLSWTDALFNNFPLQVSGDWKAQEQMLLVY